MTVERDSCNCWERSSNAILYSYLFIFCLLFIHSIIFFIYLIDTSCTQMTVNKDITLQQVSGLKALQNSDNRLLGQYTKIMRGNIC